MVWGHSFISSQENSLEPGWDWWRSGWKRDQGREWETADGRMKECQAGWSDSWNRLSISDRLQKKPVISSGLSSKAAGRWPGWATWLWNKVTFLCQKMLQWAWCVITWSLELNAGSSVKEPVKTFIKNRIHAFERFDYVCGRFFFVVGAVLTRHLIVWGLFLCPSL